MATTDDGYAVYWETGGKNHMTARELRSLQFDPASWVAFLYLLAGQRSYAPMTSHAPPPQSHKLKAKVIPMDRVKANTTYETIQ
jgi:hypothetical protein